jgi:crotonobetainyl-CoA:carnitine CoA-transferase CaiB-like acyl-CoA transferase
MLDEVMGDLAPSGAKQHSIRALEGLRVVDSSQGIAGPQCTRHLAEAGASVIKVEPLVGDMARAWRAKDEEVSATFAALNRGKLSLAVDTTQVSGKEILARLLRAADVFVCDETDSAARQLGVDHHRSRRANPRLVYCSITPFGDYGAYSSLGGSELIIQAMGDYLTCLGSPSSEPVRLGFAAAQMTAGIHSLQGILAALFQRWRTGTGQYVTISWLGSLLHIHGLTWAAFSHPDSWGGQHHDLYSDPPRHAYQASDGEIYVTVGRMTDADWDRLNISLEMADVLRAHPSLARNWRESIEVGRFATPLRPVWDEVFTNWKRALLLDILRDLGANAVPVNTLNDIARDPQVAAVHMIGHGSGELNVPPSIGVPWKLSLTPSESIGTSPRLGEHSVKILTDLGFTDLEVGEYMKMGTIIQAA